MSGGGNGSPRRCRAGRQAASLYRGLSDSRQTASTTKPSSDLLRPSISPAAPYTASCSPTRARRAVAIAGGGWDGVGQVVGWEGLQLLQALGSGRFLQRLGVC